MIPICLSRRHFDLFSLFSSSDWASSKSESFLLLLLILLLLIFLLVTPSPSLPSSPPHPSLFTPLFHFHSITYCSSPLALPTSLLFWVLLLQPVSLHASSSLDKAVYGLRRLEKTGGGVAETAQINSRTDGRTHKEMWVESFPCHSWCANTPTELYMRPCPPVGRAVGRSVL